MQTNILEYLESTAERCPQKMAFADDELTLNFAEFRMRARRTGSFLADNGAEREPVVVYMKKSPLALSAYFGVVYAGCYYVPIDDEMPLRRIELILETVDSKFLICDETTAEKVSKIGFSGQVFDYSQCVANNENAELLDKISSSVIDTDPVCIFFTSGSTGVPKGVVGYHRGIIDYTENLCQVMGFDENSVFGNQTPIYWDASMKEIYATLKLGAGTWIIPKELFMFPVKLVEYLNEHKINSVCWVVSALTMISAFGTFDVVKPEYLKTIGFGGEVFPVKQFNIWKKELPEADFFNLYGPTEITGVCTYYHADRLFEDGEVIPIGVPFKNTGLVLLDSEGRQVAKGEKGEICVRGTGVALGYYNNSEKTEEVFVQNPLNKSYRDIIYRTGDLGWWNDEGNLVFASRKDYQIKHMGHRIELGEIEAIVSSVEEIKNCCCVYIKENNKIVLFYSGDIDKKQLTVQLKDMLPRYMLPNAIRQMDALPLTVNGKLDRMKMQEIYKQKK